MINMSVMKSHLGHDKRAIKSLRCKQCLKRWVLRRLQKIVCVYFHITQL